MGEYSRLLHKYAVSEEEAQERRLGLALEMGRRHTEQMFNGLMAPHIVEGASSAQFEDVYPHEEYDPNHLPNCSACQSGSDEAHLNHDKYANEHIRKNHTHTGVYRIDTQPVPTGRGRPVVGVRFHTGVNAEREQRPSVYRSDLIFG